jgi:hypothetical protein
MAHYGLEEDRIHRIPLPIGDSLPFLERDPATWERGTVYYMGRLERRKGVIEWIEAAVTVANKYPNAQFEFVGANVLGNSKLSGEEFVDSLIPENIRTRFYFRGEQKRSDLPQFLAGARLAVVPSRWENFPNTCIEAMCSGMPVIATMQGGMADMLDDGRTGWLAERAERECLAEALRRALETPPAQLAEMGRKASFDIRKMCDNKKILEMQLDFRNQIVDRGSKRSLYLPVNLPWAKTPFSEKLARRSPRAMTRQGLAVVVTCHNTGEYLEECLRSIKEQTRKPAAVVIVDNYSTEENTRKALSKARKEGWQVIFSSNGDPVSAKNAGIETILDSGLKPTAFAFLSAEDCLQPDFISSCVLVLDHCPEVGLVSYWAHQSDTDNEIWIRPCPSFPYQWLANEAVSCSAVRTEALLEASKFRQVMSQGYENWDLFNAVLANEWVAVTLPKILGHHWDKGDSMTRTTSAEAQVRMRQELLERFPKMIARDARDIVLLNEYSTAQSLCEELNTLRNQLDMAKRMIKHPQSTTLRIAKKIKGKILRCTQALKSNIIDRVNNQHN